jgi:hypothetical protein
MTKLIPGIALVAFALAGASSASRASQTPVIEP